MQRTKSKASLRITGTFLELGNGAHWVLETHSRVGEAGGKAAGSASQSEMQVFWGMGYFEQSSSSFSAWKMNKKCYKARVKIKGLYFARS